MISESGKIYVDQGFAVQEFPDRENSTQPRDYGAVRSPEALGRLFRQERKRQGLTLEALYALTGLSMRFLSEFERGKPNVSLARVMRALQALGLEMLIFTRDDTAHLLQQSRRAAGEPPR